jgi:haloacetate dehalogenase
MFFDGFTLDETGPIRMRIGGSGPPLLLLHGQPQTHAMWHAVAARIADRFTLVCPDLAPRRSEADLAADMLGLMSRLGHERFGVAGHDLGGHVACRMALDAPSRVLRLATLGIVPIPEHVNRADMAYALSGYPSSWFAQLHPKPEALVTHAPAEWFRADAPRESGEFFHPEAVADYLRAQEHPNDRGADSVPTDSRAVSPRPGESGHRLRLTCPVLVIWGSRGRIGGWYDPLQLWRECVDNDVSGGPVPAAHFLAEKTPDTVAAAFRDFFADDRSPPQDRQSRQNQVS